MTRICIFAKSELEASRFAQTQNWGKECWFYPHSITDLRFKKNFHDFQGKMRYSLSNGFRYAPHRPHPEKPCRPHGDDRKV